MNENPVVSSMCYESHTLKSNRTEPKEQRADICTHTQTHTPPHLFLQPEAQTNKAAAKTMTEEPAIGQR